MKRYIIDRIEEGFAVVECDGEMLNIKLNILPEGVKSGDVLTKSDGNFIINQQEQQTRQQKILKLQQELFE